MMNAFQAHASAQPTQVFSHQAGLRARRCRHCGFGLRHEDGDDISKGLCGSCKNNPEAGEPAASAVAPMERVAPAEAPRPFAGLVAAVTGEHPPMPTAAAPSGRLARARPFSDADLAMIRKIGAFMPEQKLLDILNERLACDLGSDEVPYTLEQLTAAIQEAHGASNPVALGRDWPSLRKLLAQARRSGVLDQINEQVIDDFAVVFQLNAKQVVELKDIVLGAKDE